MIARNQVGLTAVGLVVAAILAAHAHAETRQACPGGISPVAALVTLDGTVSAADRAGTQLYLALGDALCPGDVVATGDDGRVELRFTDRNTTVGLTRNSSIRLPPADDRAADIDMVSGMMRFISSVRGLFTIRTRHANAGIDGTEAVIAVEGEADDSLFLVLEGDVTVTAARGGALKLVRGQAGYVSAAAPLVLATTAGVPERFRGLVADPAGAVDWAIHSPPVLPADAPARLRDAAALLDAGDPDGAEALLAGQTSADALALRAVIAVLRNRRDEGAALAAEAVSVGPGQPAPLLAQSYALQAEGRIAEARRAAEAAVAAAPDDVNAQARLAELLLTEGDRARAARVIRRVPDDRHTAASRAVQGLAALASNDYATAEAAFEQGIALDSEAPLPRLGLGLLLIRRGDLAAGRRELELAAALDPRRAATRSWLGRAYLDEGRADKAASQFDEAKARDPDDPLPWVLSAQQKFAANRPVEARDDLRAAELRGQGRQVLRSLTGLGEDRAVRDAALGRVNQVLGFADQALIHGAAAAEADPTSPAAHYLLADVLNARPGRASASTSALLQAQIYDPPGKTRIRPQRAEADLALLEAPAAARASFAEFAPFFDSDGTRADVTATIGNNATFADEASFTVSDGGFSVGLGQFHYETDGFAANNDVTHDVVSLQGRAEVTPWLDLFTEFRLRDTDSGDRALEFDLDLANKTIAIDDERHLARLGFHAELGASQDVAGVFTYVERDESLTQTDFFDPDGFSGQTTDQSADRESWEAQLQHVGRFGPLTTIAGLSYAEADFGRTTSVSLFFGDVIVPAPPDILQSHLRQYGAYGYGTWRFEDAGLFSGSEVTLGVSVESFDDGTPDGRDSIELNPKVGARLQLGPATLRGAYTQAVTPPETLAQRLEPATVAGFAQFVDNFEGSIVQQAAAGGEVEVLPWLSVGGETAWRWIDLPRVSADTKEREFRGFANATLGKRTSTALELRNERSTSNSTADLSRFEVTELNGRVSYFHPGGFFASAGLGYVWHKFRSIDLRSGRDDFPIADIAVGYRLPDQRGLVSLEIQNAFDKSVRFEDRPVQSLQTPTADPRFARAFSVMGRLQLRF